MNREHRKTNELLYKDIINIDLIKRKNILKDIFSKEYVEFMDILALENEVIQNIQTSSAYMKNNDIDINVYEKSLIEIIKNQELCLIEELAYDEINLYAENLYMTLKEFINDFCFKKNRLYMGLNGLINEFEKNEEYIDIPYEVKITCTQQGMTINQAIFNNATDFKILLAPYADSETEIIYRVQQEWCITYDNKSITVMIVKDNKHSKVYVNIEGDYIKIFELSEFTLQW